MEAVKAFNAEVSTTKTQHKRTINTVPKLSMLAIVYKSSRLFRCKLIVCYLVTAFVSIRGETSDFQGKDDCDYTGSHKSNKIL